MLQQNNYESISGLFLNQANFLLIEAQYHHIQRPIILLRKQNLTDHNLQLWETNFRVTKIKNLGYKSEKREPERKLRTNRSSRWSCRSESSANRSLMVAVCSPYTAFFRYCTAFVFLASDVVDATVEERREVVNGLHYLRVLGQRLGWRRDEMGMISGLPNFAREKRKWSGM